jgi:uncharacterized membrane protein
MTLPFLPLHFERPGWLVILLLLVPAFLLARRSIGGLSRIKSYATFALRAVVITMLSVALARPVWEKTGKGLCVNVILDRSASIPLAMKEYAVSFLARAAEAGDRRPEDMLSVVAAAREPLIVAMPDVHSALDAVQEPPDLDGTDLEAAVDLVQAYMRHDVANRIVLASDGNETDGSLLAAAELAAANNVPIDVLPLEYEHAREVIFERITAPARARPGQSAALKLVLRSQGRASGRVTLAMNEEVLDLNGAEPGTALPVELPPGLTVLPVTVSLDATGPLQFEAVFEPGDPAGDGIARNNRAVAVTFVGSEGKVLVVDEANASEHLVRALRAARLDVTVVEPGALARGPVFLAGFDAVLLVDVPRWAISDEEDRAIHAYVHDIGGGLVMIGGRNSFGAGGWIDSDVSRVLPVKLDPPQTRQMTRGALVLIMHSTEIPQGNYWGQKVAIMAIEVLSRLDYVGILDYDWQTGGVAWEYGANGPELAGDKTAAIAAAKKMVMGDMPDFDTAMKAALNGLAPLNAGQKHVIIISDGDPSAPSQAVMNGYVQANVSVSTVLLAGHQSPQDIQVMQQIATITGGRFYGPITNPRKLPTIFIKEAKLVSRSLIVEGDVYQPQVVSGLPGPVDGFPAVPSIDGYVLTAPREGLAQVPIVNATSEGNDPIYAHWNYGLGRAIAYTSDLTGTWGSRWAGWAQLQAFWEQSVRWAMRPGAPPNIVVETTHEGDRAVVDVEALDVKASSVNFLSTSAAVLRPDATSEPLQLRQVGPGRYRGEFETQQEGAYLVNINFQGGTEEAPVHGAVQAAVSVPYPREFRAVRHNAALLEQVAARTGGRVLSGADPALLGLFDRGTLPLPRSPRAVWDLLAIIAAALFVLDVAARRLSVDRRELRAFFARLAGRRAATSTETVAAWKRVARRRRAAAPMVPAARDAAPSAFDVRQETGGGPRAAPPAAEPQRPEPPAPDGEGDYTARLLAAKRRARGGDRSDRPEGGEAGG